MSELTNRTNRIAGFRWGLLSSASTLVIMGLFQGSAVHAADSETDKPTVWIELGGQLSGLDNHQETFAPSLFDARPAIFDPSQPFERMARYSLDETGKISVQPENSDWVFAASLRYGRSTSNKHVRQQTNPQPFHKYFPNYPSEHSTVLPAAQKFADTSVRNNESHLLVDFQAGKDVGLGMFGVKDGSSVVNLGVRFAQFGSKSTIALKSNPDWHFNYKYLNYPSVGYNNWKAQTAQPYHSNAATLHASRSFHGIGPSISWDASAPIAGNRQGGELNFDWGLNGALLFGRQKAVVSHQTTAKGNGAGTQYNRHGYLATISRNAPPASTRSHSVIVPNVGGFAGLSFRYDTAKVSFGYRADFFFGAMDGGIDVRKTYDRDFYGPFATISIGLGG